MKLDGSVALVTGSSSGIGAATAIALAGRGCRVAITWTNNEESGIQVLKLCQAQGVEAMLVHLDVADDSECKTVVSSIIKKWGSLGVLVNSAGITHHCALEDLDGLNAEDFLEIYRVNVVGAFQITRAATPHLRANSIAHVVNVASMAALNGRGSSIAYSASKGAMVTMTKSLARALGPEVRVNAICPGLVKGRWLEKSFGVDSYESRMRLSERKNTLKAIPTPEDVADMIVSLIQGFDLTTGDSVIIDGGAHLGVAGLASTKRK